MPAARAALMVAAAFGSTRPSLWYARTLANLSHKQHKNSGTKIRIQGQAAAIVADVTS